MHDRTIDFTHGGEYRETELEQARVMVVLKEITDTEKAPEPAAKAS